MIKSGRAFRGISALLIIAVVCTLHVTRGTEEPGHTLTGSMTDKNGNVSGIVGEFKMMKVYIASSLSVFIVSAVGLLGVAVVPLVRKVFYHTLIQYLVALAVGSLTGDAFLHLLPHAILGGHKESKDGGESNEEFIAVMKGLVALCGVFFFFLAEKCLTMISDYRSEKKAEAEANERMKNDPRRSEIRQMSALTMSIGSTGNRRASNYLSGRESAMFRRLSKMVPSEHGEEDIITTGLSTRAMRSIDNLIRFADFDVDENKSSCLQSGLDGSLRVVPSLTVTYQNPSHVDGIERVDRDIPLSILSLPIDYKAKSAKTNHADDIKRNVNTISLDDAGNSKTITNVAMRKHGHSHEVPGSVAAVAWMVILGDGLHNFSDGLAIGAAFADKIAGGISTTVAVFCHELPHELGDFAVLLKAGMTVKQALFYNVVSSVLCFLGMFIGIALNNIVNATSWIFAITAGTFVYIALVDMLPELNSVEIRPGESRIKHLVIQIAGLLTGVGVMLLIAIFEDNIKAMLD